MLKKEVHIYLVHAHAKIYVMYVKYIIMAVKEIKSRAWWMQSVHQ